MLLFACARVRVLMATAEQPKGAKGAKKGKPVNKDRFISKMFLRGDGIILVLKVRWAHHAGGGVVVVVVVAIA